MISLAGKAITQKPVLYDYFKDSSNVLLAQYNRSKGQEASANLGYNRELFCDEFLSHVLPPRLSNCRGEIWDSQGNRTGQLDLIIIRDDAPILTLGGADTVLAEGVFAVIEVKSNLTREKLIEANNSLRRVQGLELRSNVAIHSGPMLNRPLRCIFSYESATWDTLTSEIIKPENAGIADLICVLDKGVIVSRGLLVSWNNANPFAIVKGNAASIAFLYQHLVGYSANFMARVIDLDPYFEPFNGWIDPEF